MKYRTLGKTGYKVSEISLGTWQLGGKWGEEFSEENALKTLKEAYESKINFIDTADCYRGGIIEKTIGKFIKNKDIIVSTKIGRKGKNEITDYTYSKMLEYINGSIKNLDVESLDLVLLHCPPREIFDDPNVFLSLEKIKNMGLIKHYGVSVENVDDAIKAMNYNISAIEVIFNMFRLKPSYELFDLAKKNNVGLIIRVPLASGLLTGKFDENSVFNPNDHRFYNRNGERFNKGETFSGIDYSKGIKAVLELKKRFNSLDIDALRFILSYDISTVIPGASTFEQIKRNVEASNMDLFTIDELNYVKEIYNKYFKEMDLLY